MNEAIGNYRIERLIGRGGMGEVYLAHDDELRRKVAIKVVRDSGSDPPRRRDRQRREARAIARLEHPGIVRIHHVVSTDDSKALVMEWVEGRTLGQLLREDGPLSVEDALPLFVQLSSALAHAHAAGFVHRDLKPHNIMITPTGRAKILDFGLAKFLGEPSEASTRGRVLGTVAFMSPEQAGGLDVGLSSDLFSLGVVFFYVLTGHSPFGGQTVAERLGHICYQPHTDPRALDVEIPEPLCRLIDELLKKSADRRPASAADVASCLKAIGIEGARLGGAAEDDLDTRRSERPSAADAATLDGVEDEPTRVHETFVERVPEAPGSTPAPRLAAKVRSGLVLGLLAVVVGALAMGPSSRWFPAARSEATPPILAFGGFLTRGVDEPSPSLEVWDDLLPMALQAFDGLSVRTIRHTSIGELEWTPEDWPRLAQDLGVEDLLIGRCLEARSAENPHWILELKRVGAEGTAHVYTLTRSHEPTADDVIELAQQVRARSGVSALSPAEREMVRRLWPQEPDALESLALGTERLHRDEARRAERRLAEVLAHSPDEPMVLLARSRALEHLGETKQATTLARRAAELMEGWPTPMRDLVMLETPVTLEDPAANVELWERLVRRHPHRTDYVLGLAEALDVADRHGEVRTLLLAGEREWPTLDRLRRHWLLCRALLGEGRAREAFDEARRWLDEEELPDAWKGRMLWVAGSAARSLERYDEAFDFLDRARFRFAKLGDSRSLRDLFFEIAIVARSLGEKDALTRFRRYAETARQQGRAWEAALAEVNIGSILVDTGQAEQALPTLTAALDELRASGLPAEVASAAINLGAAQQSLVMLQAAEASYAEASVALETTGDLEWLALVATNRGEVELLRGFPSNAIALHRQALDVNERLGLLGAVAHDRLRLGEALYQAGELESARQLFLDLVEGSDPSVGLAIEAEAELGLARAQLDLQNLGEVERRAERAEAMFWELGRADLAVRARLVRVELEWVRRDEVMVDDLLREVRSHVDVSADPITRLDLELVELRAAARADSGKLENLCAEGRRLERISEALDLGSKTLEIRYWLGETCLSSDDARQRHVQALCDHAESRGLMRIRRIVCASPGAHDERAG